MSNLRGRLNKTAGDYDDIKAKIIKIVEEEIIKEANRIGWEDGSDGVVELVDSIMQSEFNFGVSRIAEAIGYSTEIWAEETHENFPNGAER